MPTVRVPLGLLRLKTVLLQRNIIHSYSHLKMSTGIETLWYMVLSLLKHLTCQLFDGVFPEIRKRLQGKKLVAHNESFDRNVLMKTMHYYGLYYDELELANRWECTCKIYKAKGYKPANLKACSERNGIELNHHEALSDARACAKLYLLHDGQVKLHL